MLRAKDFFLKFRCFSFRFLLPLFLLLLFCSCSGGITLKEVSEQERGNYYRKAMIQSNGLSFKTANFLKSNLLEDIYRNSPNDLIRLLEDSYTQEKNPQLIEFISDLCFNAADRMDDKDIAIKYYLSSAQMSYGLLFGELRDQSNFQKYDPSVFQTLLRYNRSVSAIFSYLKEKNLLYNDSYQLETASGQRVNFVKPLYKLPYPLANYKFFELCSAYRVRNLSMFTQQFGVGVPLISVVTEENPYHSLRLMADFSLPVTLLIAFNKAKNDGSITDARLEFMGTINRDSLTINGEKVPLSVDYSTPIAYFMSIQKEENLLRYMLNPDKNEKETGIYTLEPYDPDKIPVIFVHGLMSSPSTWIQMINALKDDPFIRHHYQFWFYKYSSGNPVYVSAANFRNSVLGAQKEFATTETSKKTFSQMLIVGHSMGGLIARTMALKSGTYFVESFTGEPWETFRDKLDPKELKFAENMIFEHPDFVTRLVFMAVPHRGSAMAKWRLAKLGSFLTSLPAELVSGSINLMKKVVLKRPLEWKDRIPTGIDNLAPDNLFIQMISNAPFPNGVKYHSIIGNHEQENTPGGTDGVVSYASSHLDGAASELIVKSGHAVHTSPAAVKELCRIMHLHLADPPKN